jgi:ubiquinol-cytochrome c reductase cytochrome c1 subunit
MARSKGSDYLYNFLRGFFLDPNSPTGVDTAYLRGTSMPHVLWELQGFQEAVFVEAKAEGDKVLAGLCQRPGCKGSAQHSLRITKQSTPPGLR